MKLFIGRKAKGEKKLSFWEWDETFYAKFMPSFKLEEYIFSVEL